MEETWPQNLSDGLGTMVVVKFYVNEEYKRIQIESNGKALRGRTSP